MRSLAALAAVLLLACSGTDAEPARTPHGPSTTTSQSEAASEHDETESPARLALASDFLMQWARGSGAAFVDQGSLRGDGQLIWVRAPVGEAHPRVLETRVSPEELAAIQATLTRADYFALAPEYAEPGVHDGDQLTLRLRALGETHRVRCDNRMPDEVTAITRAIDALFTHARAAALASSPRAQPEDFDPSLVAE